MARLAASSKLQDSYADALPASRALYERARRLFPDAVTHDNRRMQPFPLYVARADGAYKWDVDGNRYVDYWMGHGALLLGHNPRQVGGGRARAGAARHHYGACHEKEVEWGEWVCRLVPSAERVRFTGTGTEATHMAVRLAWRVHGQASRRQVRRATSTAGTRGSRSACARPTRPSPRPASFPRWSIWSPCCRPTTSPRCARDSRRATWRR